MGFPKLWVEVRGQPLLAHAIAGAIAALPAELVVVVSADRLASAGELLNRMAPAGENRLGFVGRVVAGGPRRRDSVAAGVAASSAEWLAVHDAARAFAPPQLFADGLAAAHETGAAVPGVPLKDTVKRVSNRRVIATPLRAEHVAVQTPQIFRRDVLERALALNDDDVTDEAALVEQLGIAIAVFEGDERAFKVTTPLDFALATTLLADASAATRLRPLAQQGQVRVP